MGTLTATSSVVRGDAASLLPLRVADLFRYVMREKLSFLFLNIYLFFEYVRPQSLYPVIDVLPYGTIALAGVLASFALEGRGIKLRAPADVLLLLYLAIVLLSSVFAYSPEYAYENLYIFISWVLVYFLIVNIVVTESRLFVFTLAFLLYSFKMSQHGTRSWAAIGFQFRDWGTYGAPGWFQNSGEFGIQMTIFFPIAVYFWIEMRRQWPWWKSLLVLAMPVTAVLGMIASSSRGALLGGAAGAMWMLYKSKYKVRGFTILAVLAVLLYALIPTEQKERLADSGSDQTSVERLDMWKDGLQIAREHPLIGIGYFNWIPYRVAQGKRMLLSHNIFIQCMTEVGYTGLLVLLALIGCTFWMNHESRKRLRRIPVRKPFLWAMAYGLDGALVGFICSGFFVTVLYYPFLWINLAFTSALYGIVKTSTAGATSRRAAAPSGVNVCGCPGSIRNRDSVRWT
jgi:O-antigen ligase